MPVALDPSAAAMTAVRVSFSVSAYSILACWSWAFWALARLAKSPWKRRPELDSARTATAAASAGSDEGDDLPGRLILGSQSGGGSGRHRGPGHGGGSNHRCHNRLGGGARGQLAGANAGRKVRLRSRDDRLAQPGRRLDGFERLGQVRQEAAHLVNLWVQLRAAVEMVADADHLIEIEGPEDKARGKFANAIAGHDHLRPHPSYRWRTAPH